MIKRWPITSFLDTLSGGYLSSFCNCFTDKSHELFDTATLEVGKGFYVVCSFQGSGGRVAFVQDCQSIEFHHNELEKKYLIIIRQSSAGHSSIKIQKKSTAPKIIRTFIYHNNYSKKLLRQRPALQSPKIFFFANFFGMGKTQLSFVNF